MNTQLKHVRAIVIASVVVIGGMLAFALDNTTLRGMADRLLLLPKEEHYTELYFEDPAHLPKTYTPGKKEKFAFTLHNLEGEDKDYTFQAFFVPYGIEHASTSTLSTEILHVPLGGYMTKEIVYTLVWDQAVSKGSVVVRILNTDQEIHFNVTR